MKNCFSGKNRRKQSYCLQARSQRGMAVLLLFIIVIVAFCASVVAAAGMVRYCALRQKALVATEGASLALANDLSSIVIEDPNFGYISLSDYAPESGLLIAGDGAPLPVRSINTIVGTARVDLLIARQLNNQEFIRLAEVDAANARAAALRLSRVLREALSDAGSMSKNDPDKLAPARDRKGNPVDLRLHARRLLQDYLKRCGLDSRLQIESVRLSLGSLDGGSGSVTALPQPLALAELKNGKRIGDRYVAFQNVPVGQEDFYFVGVGKQSALVSAPAFKNDDGKIPCSIVRVEASFKLPEEKNSLFGGVKVAACSQPFSLSDCNNPGTLIVSMPDGMPPNLRSLQDFLSDRQLNRETVPVYRACGGDCPVDTGARFVPALDRDGIAQRPTLAGVFARGLYDWIRTAACRPRIDSVARAIGDRLLPDRSGVPIYYLRINGAGNVETTCSRGAEFANQIVHDGQDYVLAAGSISCQDLVWTLAYRDQVRNISASQGGKHGGQLMQLTTAAGTGDGLTEPAVEQVTGSRKSYLKGGLAVEFVVSSPQMPNAL
ncbi:MAG: hypothetical protein KGS72_01690 [Cyanobacteria bacterium REEB67]|nr:hypothetical protein [Cyanobacteria bacterium REEB67]